LYSVISNGVPGTEMPSFREPLDESNIWRLVTYVRSLSHAGVAPMKGDWVAGEKLFWGKGGCGGCHRVGTRGGRMGPDLTRIGRTRSLKYLRDSVISPNDDLTPGYNTITVVTRDGKKIVGVQRGFDNFSAQLMDAQDNYYSFLKSDVVSAKREFRSIMPAGYGKMFAKPELDDVVAVRRHGNGAVVHARSRGAVRACECTAGRSEAQHSRHPRHFATSRFFPTPSPKSQRKRQKAGNPARGVRGVPPQFSSLLFHSIQCLTQTPLVG
jgi:putative heme-binding domain-containing protein